MLFSSQDMTWLLLKNNVQNVEERVKDKIMAFKSVLQLRTLRKIDATSWKKNLAGTLQQFHIPFLQLMALVNIETLKHRNIEYPEMEGTHQDNQIPAPVSSQPQESPRVPQSIILNSSRLGTSALRSNLKHRSGKCDLRGKKGMKGACGCGIRSLLWDFTSFQIQEFTRR